MVKISYKYIILSIISFLAVVAFFFYDKSKAVLDRVSVGEISYNQRDSSQKHSIRPTHNKENRNFGKSKIRSTENLTRISYADTVAAIERGEIPIDWLQRVALKFDDKNLSRSLFDYFFMSPNYSPSEKIQIANELTDETSEFIHVPTRKLFGAFSRDPEIGWDQTIELARSVSNPSVRDSAYKAAYMARYYDSRDYEDLISENTLQTIGTIRESDSSRADFITDVFDFIFAETDSDMTEMDSFMQAVEKFDGPERFKALLAFRIGRSNRAAFEKWSNSTGKYQNLTFESLKELYKN